MAPAPKKTSAKKTVKKSTKKASAKTKAKSTVKKATKQQSEEVDVAMRKFINDLAKLPHVKILTKEESDKFFAENDFYGCIAVPKDAAMKNTHSVSLDADTDTE